MSQTHYAIQFSKSIHHSYVVEANLCLGHSTHLIYDSLDHINLSTVLPLISHSEHCHFRFAQTRSSLNSLSFGRKFVKSEVSNSQDLQVQAVNSSYNTKNALLPFPLWNLSLNMATLHVLNPWRAWGIVKLSLLWAWDGSCKYQTLRRNVQDLNSSSSVKVD